MNIKEFLINNLSSIVAAVILVLLLAAVITALIRRKKSGKTACGCDCAFCGRDCQNRK
ncbi:MAG: FeoB-associated Cys-rich membrane protein [Clostridia bacterium]|nr:FeoB-associated Cys-rich membrane protein [Clostridia bacterium]